MTDDSEYAVPAVLPHKRISIVWLLPFLAVMIGAWLVYRNIVAGDIEVSLHLPTGEGITAAKTEVKYQGISIGLVRDIQVKPDLNGVVATIDFERAFEQALTEGTQFWLVSPEISLMGISGLNTLVSGSYITVLPGPAGSRPMRDFVALDEPPAGLLNKDGIRLRLLSEDLGSINRGSPVHYRKFHVGEVEDYVLLPDGSGVEMTLFIDQAYAPLIKRSTRFWNSSGFEIDGSLAGVKIRTGSLAAIVAGGISFFTPEPQPGNDNTAVESGAEFRLYPGFREANAGIPITIELPTAEGLEEGRTPLKYKGIAVGELAKIKVSPSLEHVLCTFMMDPRSAPALNESARFWLVKPEINLEGISALGNLISGNFIEMDFSLEGNPKREFVALPGPPELDYSTPGLHLKMTSEDLSSLTRGTEIYYRKIPVGNVQGYRLMPDGRTLEANLFIEPEYARLVTGNTRFWKVGGVSLKGGLSGIDLKVESLAALVRGGIAFSSLDHHTPAPPAKNGDVYDLYPSEEAAKSEVLEIAITFNSGHGLNVGTALKYQGVKIGEVLSIALDKTFHSVVLTARLDAGAKMIARENTRFWVVRPILGLAQTANLDTLLSGQYINVSPGDGQPVSHFHGLDAPPELLETQGGLTINLLSDRLGSIKSGATVYYRDVPVGKVIGYRLSSTAEKVIIAVNIEKRFAGLVHQNTVFWNASGIDVDAGLFKGVKVRTESLETILSGGISFATPPEEYMGPLAAEGSEFRLYSEPKEDWLSWHPKIPVQ
ncbi:PqiB family protein [Porticoccus sp.]